MENCLNKIEEQFSTMMKQIVNNMIMMMKIINNKIGNNIKLITDTDIHKIEYD